MRDIPYTDEDNDRLIFMAQEGDRLELESQILFATLAAPVVLLADLRTNLGNPPGFDACILRLADERRLIAMSDCHPSSEHARGGVVDGANVLTCIAKAC